MTKLDKPLKREIAIGDQAYVLTIDPAGLKLTVKGHRKGREIAWRDLVGGDSGEDGGGASIAQQGASEPAV
ncbi:MAG: hypothetical protein ACREUG_01610 [Steroidobacteraceae bacterium]